MNADLNLNPGAKDAMEGHLNSVAEVLRRSGTAEGDVQSILQDLRNQMLEMLSARTTHDPTPGDVQEVVAGMARPETYADGAETTARNNDDSPKAGPAPRAISRTRFLVVVFGFVLVIGGLILPAWGIRPVSGLLAIGMLGFLATVAFRPDAVRWFVRIAVWGLVLMLVLIFVKYYVIRSEARQYNKMLGEQQQLHKSATTTTTTGPPAAAGH